MRESSPKIDLNREVVQLDGGECGILLDVALRGNHVLNEELQLVDVGPVPTGRLLDGSYNLAGGNRPYLVYDERIQEWGRRGGIVRITKKCAAGSASVLFCWLHWQSQWHTLRV